MRMFKKFHFQAQHIFFLVFFLIFFFLPLQIFAASEEGRLRVHHVLETDPLQAFSITSLSQKVSSDEFFYSPVLDLKFNATAFGFSWIEDSEILPQIKYFEKGKWSQWIPVHKGHLPSEAEPQRVFSDLLFSQQTEKIILRHTDKEFLKDVEIIYIDASEGPQTKKISIASANSSLKIISRSEWGADESYRFRNKGDLSTELLQELQQKNAEIQGETIEIWPIEYADVKKFVMHETDGYNGGDDPATTVRGIYHWHAKTLGWGDIGYNYLVDSLGNIYEGRKGGDGVIAGHVYHTQSVTNPNDTKVSVGFNMNVGSIGISVLGSYDSDVATGPAQIALAKLLTQKALDFQIDPLGSDSWKVPIVKVSKDVSDADFLSVLPKSTKLYDVKGISYELDLSDETKPQILLKNVTNFTGHKDIDYKRDPQENLMGVFTNSRTLASQDYHAQLKNGIRLAATIINQSTAEVRLNKDQSQVVSVSVRNDGETTWHRYTKKNILLASYTFDRPNVAPGEIATFSWTITPPQNKAKEQREYILAMNEVGFFDEARVGITVVNLDLALADYAAEFSSHNFPPAFLDNAKPKLVLQYKNVGKLSWKKGDLLINVIEMKNETRPSPWKDKTWKTEFLQISFLEEEVLPDGLATFEIPFANLSPGIFRHRFYITREVKQNGVVLGDEKIIGSDKEIETRVDARFGAAITHTLPPAIKTSWRPKVSFTIKNSGLSQWKDTLKLVNLYKPKDVTLSFIDNSWKSKDIIAQKNVNLKPGESITLEFKIDAPKKQGTYDFKYKLLIGKQEIFIGSSKEQTIKVRVD